MTRISPEAFFSMNASARSIWYPALTMRTYVSGGGNWWLAGSGKFVTGETLDVWANDQDWSLYYAALYLRSK